MTENQLKEIEERLDAATYGPWNQSGFGFQVLTGDSWQTICRLHPEFNENHQLDALFIAHSRTDVGHLLREVRRLRKLAAACERYLRLLDEERAIPAHPTTDDIFTAMSLNDKVKGAEEEMRQILEQTGS